MADKKCNVDHLHDEGLLNKDELHEDSKKALNELSTEEVEQLKSISKKYKDKTGKAVGITI